MADSSVFNTAVGMCQMLLRQRGGERKSFFSVEQIAATVDELLAMPSFTGIDRVRLIAELERRFTVLSPKHSTLEMNDDHVAWLPQKQGSIQWRYWDRYKLMLIEKLPQSAVESVEDVVTDVLERVEDPDRTGAWDRRGLVMGHVQSGKTANYTGLICKAADAGYKVIIVLTGMHSSLRSQTQIRLDEGFLGFRSQPRSHAEIEAFVPVGVGLLDSSVRANTGTNRTEKGDFSRAVANQFGIHPGGLPLLFVVKKNGRVLSNLLSWIRSSADGYDQENDRKYVRNVPMLMIDDEADVASIDTKEQQFDDDGRPDLEHDPSSINKLVRRILRAFEKVAYVGYTATPFANIFIHDQGMTKELGADVFPRSFIINIPTPSNYVGPARVFGIPPSEDGAEFFDPLPLVRTVVDHANSDLPDEEHGWMPPKLLNKTKHVPEYDGQQQVPPSLRQAIMAFVLVIAVRRRRNPLPHHNSMLVHAVRYADPQKHVAQQVDTALKEIVQRLRLGDGERRPTIRDELRKLWETDFIPTHQRCAELVGIGPQVPELPEWAEVDAVLLECAAAIKVRTINGTAGDILDYEEHKSAGLNVIAVGGDKLARGLTLEGLSVSYFLRASRMYDTLMQMGRWFGYREGFLDLCRLYSTTEIIGWFTHIALASEELRREFDAMVAVGGSPKDYGLKVLSHPVLLVTSAVKMRHGKEMSLSFDGDISETIIFSRNIGWIARNFSVTEDWLARLGSPTEVLKGGSAIWKKRRVDEVLDFLSAYTTHRDALRANTVLLSRYIRAQHEIHEELVEWTVLLCSSAEASEPTITGLKVGLIRRQPFPDSQGKDRYTIRRLVSPRDEMRDLTDEQFQRALAATVAEWNHNRDAENPNEPEPTVPSGIHIRAARPNTQALLMIYPLDPKYAQMQGDCKPIVGIAVSFPGTENAEQLIYAVNNVFTTIGGDDDDGL